MSEPRPTVTRFVQAAVRVELERGSGVQESDVAEQVMRRLYQELAKLLGPEGCDALLRRSLVLARREHPALAGVSVSSGGTFVGLDNIPREGTALREGAIAIVSQFIGLLVVLIGEDLAMLLVRDIWPLAAEEEQK